MLLSTQILYFLTQLISSPTFIPFLSYLNLQIMFHLLIREPDNFSSNIQFLPIALDSNL